MNSRFAPWIELQPMCHKAQFMPQAIHESLAFNSCNPVAIRCVFSVKDNTLSPNPNTWTPKAHTSLRGTPKQTERARVQGKNPYILALFFINELMLSHHELALPWFLALLHELNCNQCAVRHSSCRRQFTKAKLSIHAIVRLQFIAWYSVKSITHIRCVSFFT